jgi:hypothetical protein
VVIRINRAPTTSERGPAVNKPTNQLPKMPTPASNWPWTPPRLRRAIAIPRGSRATLAFKATASSPWRLRLLKRAPPLLVHSQDTPPLRPSSSAGWRIHGERITWKKIDLFLLWKHRCVGFLFGFLSWVCRQAVRWNAPLVRTVTWLVSIFVRS